MDLMWVGYGPRGAQAGGARKVSGLPGAAWWGGLWLDDLVAASSTQI